MKPLANLTSITIILASVLGASNLEAKTYNPTSRDYDLCARTLYGEMRGASGEAQAAAVNVIYNRWATGRWGKLERVLLARKQFSAWNFGDPNQAVITDLSLDAAPIVKRRRDRVFSNAALSCALHIGSRRAGGPDMTGGCDHYWTGAKVPRWAVGLTPKRFGALRCVRLGKGPRRS